MLQGKKSSRAARSLRQRSVLGNSLLWSIGTLGAAGACVIALRRLLPRTPGKASKKTISVESANEPHAKFDLALAATLAGKAFESYMVPAGAEGYQEVDVNGVQTTYMDPEFLASSFAGILKVTLERAQDLPASDLDGKSTPYVVLSLGQSFGRSSVINHSFNPTWDETFYLYVKPHEQRLLHVKVLDSDLFTGDDPLGSGIVDAEDLLPGEERCYKVALRGRGGGGTVHLRASFLSFHGLDSPLVDQVVADSIEACDDSNDACPVSTAIPRPAGDRKQSSHQLHDASKTTAEQANMSQPTSATAITAEPSNDTIAEHSEDDMVVRLGRAGSREKGAEDVSDGIKQLTGQQLPQAWRALAHVAGLMDNHQGGGGQLVAVAYVDNPGTDTQVWLYRCLSAREVVVAFRGTQKSKLKDVLTDLNLIPTSLEKRTTGNLLAAFIEKVRLVMGLATKEQTVHDGFLHAFESVKSKVYELVEQLTADRSGGRWRVYWTGHSLGGALATLAAHETASEDFQARVNYEVTMYTYGAPRVGNRAFANIFNRRVPDSWRITNYNDLVPTVPRLMGYWHVRHGVRLTADGRFKFETEGTPDNVAVDMNVGLVDCSQQRSREARASLNEREMTWFERLVGGDVEEHMAPYYLRTLTAALLSARPDLKQEMAGAMQEEQHLHSDGAEGAAATAQASCDAAAAR